LRYLSIILDIARRSTGLGSLFFIVACTHARSPSVVVAPATTAAVARVEVIPEEHFELTLEVREPVAATHSRAEALHLHGSGAVVVDEILATFDNLAEEAACFESSNAAFLTYACEDAHEQHARLSLQVPVDLVVSRDGASSTKRIDLPAGTPITYEPSAQYHTESDVRDVGPPNRCSGAKRTGTVMKAGFELRDAIKDDRATHTIVFVAPAIRAEQVLATFTAPLSCASARARTTASFGCMLANDEAAGDVLVRGDALYAVAITRRERLVVRAPLPCGATVTLVTVPIRAPM
jgi:hypothetical protein